jgi:hypothetical protein
MEKFERITITAPVLFDNFRVHAVKPPPVRRSARGLVMRILTRLVRWGRHDG